MSSEIDKASCPAELLTGAATIAARNSARGLESVDRLIGSYRSDARLHFLRGSLLAGLQRYDEARGAMQNAITISPDFALARFQLGLLEFTSGDARSARGTWAPLNTLPQGSPLRLFVGGLEALAEDRFLDTVALLSAGIAANTQIEPLNQDMQLIIDTVREDRLDNVTVNQTGATHLLLQRYGRNRKTH